MLKVLINMAFKDRYTGKMYEANKEVEISKERATEIQNIDKSLITVLGIVEEKPKTEKDSKKSEEKPKAKE